MNSIIKRLGFFFWLDCLLFRRIVIIIMDLVSMEMIELLPWGRNVSRLIWFSLALITVFSKGPNWSKLLDNAHVAKCWMIICGILILTTVILLLSSDSQSSLALGPEFLIRISLMYIVTVLLFISFQVYFLVKKIW